MAFCSRHKVSFRTQSWDMPVLISNNIKFLALPTRSLGGVHSSCRDTQPIMRCNAPDLSPFQQWEAISLRFGLFHFHRWDLKFYTQRKTQTNTKEIAVERFLKLRKWWVIALAYKLYTHYLDTSSCDSSQPISFHIHHVPPCIFRGGPYPNWAPLHQLSDAPPLSRSVDLKFPPAQGFLRGEDGMPPGGGSFVCLGLVKLMVMGFGWFGSVGWCLGWNLGL